MIRQPLTSTLFPYTTLFRSRRIGRRSIARSNGSNCARVSTTTIRSRRFFSKSNVARTSARSEEHTSELQSHSDLVCRLLLEKKKEKKQHKNTLSRALARRTM